jgi:polysaccharide biosynthesis protein PslJ
MGAGLLALLGIIQFLTKSTLTEFFAAIPGLSMSDSGVADRGGVARVPGTAIHPLEYATVLDAALPLVIAAAISHGLRWQSTRGRWTGWVLVAIISLAALIGVSRSAIIGFAVAAVSMLPVLPRRYRGIVIIGGALLAAAAIAAIPGLLSTTLHLFAGAANDPSTQSRTGGLSRAPDFIASSPFVGAGFGTFLPRYYIFDNQWVLMAIELGILGVLAFAALFATAIWSGASARRRSTDPGVRLLGWALAASALNIGVLFAFFDGLSFPQSAGLLFMIVGLCGAVRTVGAETPDPVLAAAALAAPASTGPAGTGVRQTRRARLALRLARRRATPDRGPGADDAD